MKVISHIICILFLSVNVFASDENKLPESERYFLSGIFECYQDQLTTFIHQEVEKYPNLVVYTDDPLLTDTRNFIEYVLTPIDITVTAKRAYHTNKLLMLRSLINQIDVLHGYSDVFNFLGELSTWMYTGVDLIADEMAFVSSYLPESIFEDDSKDVSTLILEAQEQLKSLPEFGGRLRSSGKDSHLKGDLPSLLFDYDQTRIIRTPTVIKDPEWEKTMAGEHPEIAEEFKQFLRYYAGQGKTHLYVNLSENNSKEGHECRIISELETDPTVQDAVIVVRLDRNSPFYRQEDPIDLMNADVFMAEFTDELMNPSHYNWSRRLVMTEWTETLQILLSEVHYGYFQAKPELTLEERLAFIDMVHLKIVTILMDRFHPDTANISSSCSNNRSPSFYSVLFFYVLGPKSELSFEQRKQMVTLLFAPGMLVKNSPLASERVDRLPGIIHLLSK